MKYILSLIVLCTCLCSTSWSQSKTVEIWIRLFIPDPANKGAAGEFLVANPAGGSVVRLQNLSNQFNVCFATDHRGFSSDNTRTARTETRFKLRLLSDNTGSISPAANQTTAAPSKKMDCVTGALIESGAGFVSLQNMGNPAAADGTVQVIGEVKSTNTMTILGKAAPSIDYNFDVQWTPATNTVKTAVGIGAFPAFEMYARQPGGEWVPVVQQLPTSIPFMLSVDGDWIMATTRVEKSVTVPGPRGKWESPAPEKRFAFEIIGNTLKWTEKNVGGTVTREVPITETAEGIFRVERPNDDEILTMLGFSSAALRAQIRAAGAQSSFINFKFDGKDIQAEWNGLVVRKKANGTLDQVVQPGVNPPKVMVFTRL